MAQLTWNLRKDDIIMSSNTNYAKHLLVKTAEKVNLREISTHWHGKYQSHKKAQPEIQEYLEKMDELQYLMYSENKHSLLIVLQGLDAAGKDGVIRHVLTGMNPQGCTVSCFKQPTALELNHDFLWRVHPKTPRKGAVAIFNRSHYEDVLITRVHDLVSKSECSRRYRLINDFEKNLIDEPLGGTRYRVRSLQPMTARLDDPARQWKISEGDYKERDYWSKYMHAYEELLSCTSSHHAPWFIIPSDHKWFRNLCVSQIITQALLDLRMKTPKPTVDLAEIRRKYHKDAHSFKHHKVSPGQSISV